jgi:hypothetical protein
MSYLNRTNAYTGNFSNEEFLSTAFILLKKKLKVIYLLTQETQSSEIVKERYEKTSQVLEALQMLSSFLDFNKKESFELSNYYIALQQLVFKGNYSEPEILLQLSENL